MSNKGLIQIVDLFAGPGGLGEGFSSLSDTYKILVSAEMDPFAHETLRLRAFFRLLQREFPEGLDDYYRYCNGDASKPWSEKTEALWIDAGNEAQKITLGSAEGNAQLDCILNHSLDRTKPWVLIGGPPCQAYSLVGRARNSGIVGYKAEDDHRHFLYKEYLRILQQYSPSVFVMENVKGILSARINGKKIFHDILRDLSNPTDALGGSSSNGEKYIICSLATGDTYRYGEDPKLFDASKFIIRSEKYGIPQARHRVILLGIKESLFKSSGVLQYEEQIDVDSVIGSLPPLRSKLSKQPDSQEAWHQVVRSHLEGLIKSIESSSEQAVNLKLTLTDTLNNLGSHNSSGLLRYPKKSLGQEDTKGINQWYLDGRLKVWLNHEARGHMNEDLRRYVFASSFAKAHGYSPKGHKDFSLPGLRPAHQNWESGKFADRFRVQTAKGPSTTITSHISKDGHYFIHPDPRQCRSLSVREAARLQTFPDNYFFQGNRTQQYHQVGNAVPPLLASKIASIVKEIIDKI